MYPLGTWSVDGVFSGVIGVAVMEAVGISADNADDISYATTGSDYFFQLMFCAATASIVSGALAERIKLWPFLLFTLILTAFIYPLQASWKWGGGFLDEMGFLDFAGSTVVHSVGGWAALAGALILGPRIGKYKGGKVVPMPGANLPIATLGVFILWLGWFGFNAGSELAADGIAANAFLTTNTAAAIAALTWLVISGIHTGKMSAVGAATGAVAGLVAITPACGWVDVGGALMIGLSASAVCYLCALGMEKTGIDDALVVFGVHGIGGAWGALMTGVFASEAIGGVKGLLEGNGTIVLEQLVGIIATFLYSGVVTFIILKVLDVIPGLGLQEPEKVEMSGLDVNVHGERGYVSDGAD